ncbi:hypothetical protein O181_127261 [Austropuccinia psidii MF-1]|uniref:Uncharacterized protein n=1 Tax=Austropuccinia psidii MF-1 TaxID=1389203 RepID=A0A9Q3KWP3_9BASI|nr:hypothetical protein [Austropuccinia psidii MF-1]
MSIGDFSPQDFNHGLWQSPEDPSQLHERGPTKDQPTPQLQLNWTHYAGTMDGTYMVSYTIMYHFPQQSNGDVFKTKKRHSNSSPQIHHPFQRNTSQP